MNDRVTATPGYGLLASVLDEALIQAQSGKGALRHAKSGEYFEDQKIMEITRRVGLGGPAFQAVKKVYEAKDAAERGETKAAERDLLGAINYCAAMVLKIREREQRGIENSKCHNGKEHDDKWDSNTEDVK